MPKISQQRLMLPASPFKTDMNAGAARVDAACSAHKVGSEDGENERTSSSARRTISLTVLLRRVGFESRGSKAACGAKHCAASRCACGSCRTLRDLVALEGLDNDARAHL